MSSFVSIFFQLLLTFTRCFTSKIQTKRKARRLSGDDTNHLHVRPPSHLHLPLTRSASTRTCSSRSPSPRASPVTSSRRSCGCSRTPRPLTLKPPIAPTSSARKQGAKRVTSHRKLLELEKKAAAIPMMKTTASAAVTSAVASQVLVRVGQKNSDAPTFF